MQISLKIPQCLRVVLIGGITLATPVMAQQQESFDSGIARVAEALAQPLGGQTVAIFEFPDLEGRVTNLSRLVSEQLTTELVQRLVGRGRVLERRQVLQVLAELNLQKTDLTAAEVSRVGRQLGANALVLGSATTIGDQVVVNARVVRVTGGEVVAANRMSITGSQNLVALATSGIGAPSLIPSTSRTAASVARPTPQPAPQRVPFRGQVGDVTVELIGCTQGGSMIRCNFWLTSRTDGQFALSIRSRLFDQAGNEFAPYDYEIKIANSGQEANMVAGVRTSASMVFRDVPPTQSLSLFRVVGRHGSYEMIEFRNVPVGR
jgi:TolB-like protein